jgi:hypothetical protein
MIDRIEKNNPIWKNIPKESEEIKRRLEILFEKWNKWNNEFKDDFSFWNEDYLDKIIRHNKTMTKKD